MKLSILSAIHSRVNFVKPLIFQLKSSIFVKRDRYIQYLNISKKVDYHIKLMLFK